VLLVVSTSIAGTILSMSLLDLNYGIEKVNMG